MPKRSLALVALCVLVSTFGFAKTKKSAMPPYVLSAHTVAVIIDPTAGVSMDDPQANQDAQKNVETALLSWGRFEPQIGTQGADLIIVVRRGHGHLVDQTISNPRQNTRPGGSITDDNAVAMGAQHGQPTVQDGVSGESTGGPGRPQMEVGNIDDSFVVYEGGSVDLLDKAPAWRYIAKDGLRAPEVTAVDEFRKAVAEADKAAAAAAAAKKP